MAERIYHDQMNDPSNPNAKDAFAPRTEGGQFMNKDEAMDKLHNEALLDNGMSQTQINGREAIYNAREAAGNAVESGREAVQNLAEAGREKFNGAKEAAGRGVERCRGFFAGVKDKLKSVGKSMWRCGVRGLKTAAEWSVGAAVGTAKEFVRAGAEAVHDTAEGGKIVAEAIKNGAEAAGRKAVEAGDRIIKKGGEVWQGAVQRGREVCVQGRERCASIIGAIRNEELKAWAEVQMARATRIDNIADIEEDKAMRLLELAQARRQAAAECRAKAAELNPAKYGQPEAAQGASPEEETYQATA